MGTNSIREKIEIGPRLKNWSLPGKMLVTMIVLMMSIGMGGALGQIIVHDIIPTFWSEKDHTMSEKVSTGDTPDKRGDLFGDELNQEKEKLFYQTDEFIFALKFTHIHVFGMSAIFILMGSIVLFFELSSKLRTWLIILPFIGIIIDLLSVWLKIFIHPAFFWLHIPGGLLFPAVFTIDSLLVIWQAWFVPNPQ